MQEDYGGYAGRLRRLCREKEKARDRSVPVGSDKNGSWSQLFFVQLHSPKLFETLLEERNKAVRKYQQLGLSSKLEVLITLRDFKVKKHSK